MMESTRRLFDSHRFGCMLGGYEISLADVSVILLGFGFRFRGQASRLFPWRINNDFTRV